MIRIFAKWLALPVALLVMLMVIRPRDEEAALLIMLAVAVVSVAGLLRDVWKKTEPGSGWRVAVPLFLGIAIAWGFVQSMSVSRNLSLLVADRLDYAEFDMDGAASFGGVPGANTMHTELAASISPSPSAEQPSSPRATPMGIPSFLQSLAPRLAYLHRWRLETPGETVPARWDEARRFCLEELKQYQCDVVQAAMEQGSASASATMTVKLSADGVPALRARVTRDASLREEGLTAEDMAETIYDLERRLRLKEEDLDLLERDLDAAVNAQERRQKVRELAGLRAEIDQLRFDAERARDRARFSRVELSWSGKLPPPPPAVAPERPGIWAATTAAFGQSTAALGRVLTAFAVVLARLAPFLVLAPLLAVPMLVYRRRRKPA
jgi:hypothetical protein